ncbi:MAG: hypothetical protein H6661_09490 [Ardenticatenaceae bacterium]|nr:hypothetical protein [Ardenticatenaceae bacterium]
MNTLRNLGNDTYELLKALLTGEATVLRPIRPTSHGSAPSPRLNLPHAATGVLRVWHPGRVN